jgi:hypothetical protein
MNVNKKLRESFPYRASVLIKNVHLEYTLSQRQIAWEIHVRIGL